MYSITFDDIKFPHLTQRNQLGIINPILIVKKVQIRTVANFKEFVVPRDIRLVKAMGVSKVAGVQDIFSVRSKRLVKLENYEHIHCLRK